MKCANCGAELTEDSRFCSYCGNKIEPPPRQEDVPPVSLDAPGYADQSLEKGQSMLMGKRLGEWRSTWGRLDAFSKVATIILIVFLLVLAGTLLSGTAAAVITAAIQIVLAIAAALIHNGAGKLEQKLPWFKWILLVIAVTLIALPGAIYS